MSSMIQQYFNQYGSRNAKRYPYQTTLPTHSEQQGNRDPRKLWMYDCLAGQFSVIVEWSGSHRTYMFEKESDFLLFQLRWE